jgi:hypothetical protein
MMNSARMAGSVLMHYHEHDEDPEMRPCWRNVASRINRGSAGVVKNVALPVRCGKEELNKSASALTVARHLSTFVCFIGQKKRLT